jgi:hypothetical protein
MNSPAYPSSRRTTAVTKFSDDEPAQELAKWEAVLACFYTPEQIAEMKNPKPKPPGAYFPPKPMTTAEIEAWDAWDATHGKQAALAKMLKNAIADLADEKRAHAETKEDLERTEKQRDGFENQYHAMMKAQRTGGKA